MYHVHKTTENPDGSLSTRLHGAYEVREDAEEVAGNLRRLYGWIKHVEVEAASESEDVSRKKMAPSRRGHEAGPRRMSS